MSKSSKLSKAILNAEKQAFKAYCSAIDSLNRKAADDAFDAHHAILNIMDIVMPLKKKRKFTWTP